MVESEKGLTIEEARKRFYFVDSQGLVTTTRPGKLQSHKVCNTTNFDKKLILYQDPMGT